MGNAWKKNRFRSAYLRNTRSGIWVMLQTPWKQPITWDKVTACHEGY